MVDRKREQPAKQKEAITAQSTALLAPSPTRLISSPSPARQHFSSRPVTVPLPLLVYNPQSSSSANSPTDGMFFLKAHFPFPPSFPYYFEAHHAHKSTVTSWQLQIQTSNQNPPHLTSSKAAPTSQNF